MTKIPKISQTSTAPESSKKTVTSSPVKGKNLQQRYDQYYKNVSNHIYANTIIKEHSPQHAANKHRAETSILENQPVTPSDSLKGLDIGYENFCKRIQNPSSTQVTLFDDDDIIEYDPASEAAISSYQIENSFSNEICVPKQRQCEFI